MLWRLMRKCNTRVQILMIVIGLPLRVGHRLVAYRLVEASTWRVIYPLLLILFGFLPR